MRRLLILLPLLLVLLAGCIPVRQVAVDAINEIGGSHDVLSYGNPGITITPGETELLAPILDVLGTQLATSEAACDVFDEGAEIRCLWPTLDEPTTVILTGFNVTASISYRRPGDGFFRLEHLGNP